ncbi:replication protein [Eubacteriales bacterium OttesenSCG-928-G02]|nr:replication protein [Eubacteriales bacterium OttesenSCG-928-G02]
MKEKCKSGYTKIPNLILEKAAGLNLSPLQFKILMLLWRYTYGYNRDDCNLSLSFLVKATTTTKRNVQIALNGLVAMKIITVVENAAFNSARKFSFNDNFNDWEGVEVSSTTPGIDNNTR